MNVLALPDKQPKKTMKLMTALAWSSPGDYLTADLIQETKVCCCSNTHKTVLPWCILKSIKKRTKDNSRVVVRHLLRVPLMASDRGLMQQQARISQSLWDSTKKQTQQRGHVSHATTLHTVHSLDIHYSVIYRTFSFFFTSLPLGHT